MATSRRAWSSTRGSLLGLFGDPRQSADRLAPLAARAQKARPLRPEAPLRGREKCRRLLAAPLLPGPLLFLRAGPVSRGALEEVSRLVEAEAHGLADLRRDVRQP